MLFKYINAVIHFITPSKSQCCVIVIYLHLLGKKHIVVVLLHIDDQLFQRFFLFSGYGKCYGLYKEHIGIAKNK